MRQKINKLKGPLKRQINWSSLIHLIISHSYTLFSLIQRKDEKWCLETNNKIEKQAQGERKSD